MCFASENYTEFVENENISLQMEIGFFSCSGLAPKLASLSFHFSDRTFQPAEATLVLEIGCGRGEYTIELAKIHPHRLFIGADSHMTSNKLAMIQRSSLQAWIKRDHGCMLEFARLKSTNLVMWPSFVEISNFS